MAQRKLRESLFPCVSLLHPLAIVPLKNNTPLEAQGLYSRGQGVSKPNQSLSYLMGTVRVIRIICLADHTRICLTAVTLVGGPCWHYGYGVSAFIVVRERRIGSCEAPETADPLCTQWLACGVQLSEP